MTGGQRLRGQPLVALLAILCGWIGGRLSAWDAPLLAAPAQERAAVTGTDRFGDVVMAGPQTLVGGLGEEGLWRGGEWAGVYPQGWSARSGYGQDRVRIVYVSAPGSPSDAALWRRLAAMAQGSQYAVMPVTAWTGRDGNSKADPGRDFPQYPMGAFHNERFPSGFPAFGMPSSEASAFAASEGQSIGSGGSVLPIDSKPRRWSVDTWALMRGRGAGPLTNGTLPATYGASQAGAVLRYRLGLLAQHRPEIYMRTTATLEQVQRETAAAIGFSARPLAAIPVVAALEARLTEQAGQRRVQPAAMAITTIPPFALPARLRGETYVQAGYVAGRYATPFAEGQLRVDHGILRVGQVESRIGGGVWGGVQKGASRLDAGPSATVTLPLRRGVNARVGVDWRFRLAGDAEPGSGPALTLSAGF